MLYCKHSCIIICIGLSNDKETWVSNNTKCISFMCIQSNNKEEHALLF